MSIKDGSPFADVPIHIWLEEIGEKLKKFGFDECGLFIGVVDAKTGKVSASGNMSDADTVDFLAFLAAQHEAVEFEQDDHEGGMQ